MVRFEVLYGLEAAELDAQMARLEHGPLVDVALGDDAVARKRNHLGLGFLLRHAAAPPFPAFEDLNFGTMRPKNARATGLFVASMTRISTIA